jgi:hypothetical protein
MSLRFLSVGLAPVAPVPFRLSRFGFASDFGLRTSVLARALAVCFALSLLPPAGAATNAPAPPRNIGIEGHTTVTLPRRDYQPRPLDDRTELILRIESVTAVTTNGPFQYDFHYIGFEPGAYRLADFLMRPDGSAPEEVGDLRLEVRALLPDDHDGQLQPFAPPPFPFIGGYRMFLVLLAVLWAGGFVAFVLIGRRKKVVAAAPVEPPPPSLAERMRPLVEAAAAGKLTADGQAQLERLLLGFWREKLRLPEQRMAEALRQLKEHREAGILLRALERWLHQRSGASAAEVNALLEPYRQPVTPTSANGGAN